MFKVVEATLASALAASDTLTLSYPSGTNAGSFTGGVGHKLVTGANDVFKSPKYFTLSFGATSITLTWGSSSPTLPVGTKVFVQLEQPGYSSQSAREGADPAIKRTVDAPLKLINLGSPLTADADGIAASQSVSAGAAFSLDGALLGDIVANRMILDVPRNVVAAWTTASVLTITGLDEYGNVMVEKSASGTSHTGKKAFKEITSITSSASITSATVGTGVVLGLPVFLPSKNCVVAEYQSGVMLPQIGGNMVYLTQRILDAGTASSIWVASPVAGVIRKVSTILHAAISGADEVVTMEVNGTAVDGLSITIANSGSAAGDVDSDTPTYGHASTVVAVGDKLEIINSGASTGTALVTVLLEIEAYKDTHGTVVVGEVANAQSATSADVRGTYSPAVTPNGTASIELLVRLADPDFIGVDQYTG